MNSLHRFGPARELGLLQREMDRLFSEFLPNREGADAPVWTPRADLAETDDAFVVTLDLPGLAPDQVEVTLEDDTLTIAGAREMRRDEDRGRFHRIERSYGRFFRSIRFGTPVDAERVEASFDAGVLTVRVNKAESVKPRRIEVRAQQSELNRAEFDRAELSEA